MNDDKLEKKASFIRVVVVHKGSLSNFNVLEKPSFIRVVIVHKGSLSNFKTHVYEWFLG